MTIRLCLVATLLAFLSSQLFSQEERLFRSYSTQKVHSRLLEANPDFGVRLKAMEDTIKIYGKIGDYRQDTIPVVFHILYVPGQPFPSEEQILSQIEALNRDFVSHIAPPEPFVFDKIQQMENIAINPGIFFCLATDINEPGFDSAIRYVASNTQEWTGDDAIKFSANGGDDAINPGRYLNIWVGRLAENNSGYAQMPCGPNLSDGIVIDPRFFSVSGTAIPPYNEGKTLTHLVGSYLGLYELWNDLQPCLDDKVEDTPIHNAPNYAIGTNYHNVSLCDSTLAVEMVINFMDNTDDNALLMFTQGQKNRMKAVLSTSGPRANLTSNNVICKHSGVISDNLSERNSLKSKLGMQGEFRVFPNPAMNAFKVEVNVQQPGIIKFTAYNILGEVAWNMHYPCVSGTQVFQEDCSSWNSGMYIIQCVFENGGINTQKLRVERP